MRSLSLRQSQAANSVFTSQHALRPAVTRGHGVSLYGASFRYQSSITNTLSSKRAQSTAVDATHDAKASLIASDVQYAVEGIVPNLSSTRPAALNFPPPLKDASSATLPDKGKYYFRVGKAFVGMYWAGVKNVWANYKQRQQILERLSKSSTTLSAAARSTNATERVSYAEYELCIRTSKDLKKLAPFALVFTICGEFTPLVVLAIGPRIVPATCVIPKQEAQNVDKMIEREETYIRKKAENQNDAEAQMRMKLMFAGAGPRGSVSWSDLYRLGFQTSISEPGTLAKLFTTLPESYSRRSYQRRCSELLDSLILVSREGGWKEKSPQDMWEWGTKYGLHALRVWAQFARSKGNDVVSSEMQSTLLPLFERETKQIIEAADELADGEDDNSCSAAAIYNPATYSSRPDAKILTDSIKAFAKQGTMPSLDDQWELVKHHIARLR